MSRWKTWLGHPDGVIEKRETGTLGLLVSGILGLWLTGGRRVAATVWWDDDSADGKWSTAINWNPDTGINANDSPVLDDRKVGTSLMDKAASFTVTGIAVTNTSGTNVVDLSGNTLVIQSSSGNPSLSIGAAMINNAIMGPSAVEFRNGCLVVTNTGGAFIGYANQSSSPYTAVSLGGTLIAASNVQVNWTLDNNNAPLRIGHARNGSNAWGRVDMSAATGGCFRLRNTAGEFTVGGAGQTYSMTGVGSLLFGDNWTIQIGEPEGTRPSFVVGGSSATNDGAVCSGTVQAGMGGAVALYLGSFVVAQKAGWNGTNVACLGLVDFSGVSNGLLDLRASAANAAFRIGFRPNASGVVRLGSHWTIHVDYPMTNDITKQTDLYVGSLGANGTLQASACTFSGRFRRFYIGGNAGGDKGGYPTGTLDLATGIIGEQGVAAEGIHVGNALDYSGILKLPKGVVTTLQLYVGDDDSGANKGGSGYLALFGTTVNVTSNYGYYVYTGASQFRISMSGRVDYYVGTTNGLFLDNPSTHPAGGGLLIDSTNVHAGTGGLKFTFTADPPGWTVAGSANRESVFYALKWAGTNNTAYLTNLWRGADGIVGTSDDKLAWDTSALSPFFREAISIFYDASDNATYLGCYVRRANRGTVVMIR